MSVKFTCGVSPCYALADNGITFYAAIDKFVYSVAQIPHLSLVNNDGGIQSIVNLTPVDILREIPTGALKVSLETAPVYRLNFELEVVGKKFTAFVNLNLEQLGSPIYSAVRGWIDAERIANLENAIAALAAKQ